MKILVLNAGSSSHKSSLFDLDPAANDLTPPAPVWRGQLDWSHQAGQVELSAHTAGGASIEEVIKTDSKMEGLERLLKTLHQGPTQVIDALSAIDVVGHRVVHGGPDYSDSVAISETVKTTIRELIPLAPSHNPANLEGIEVLEQLLGDVPQLAAFDTAFHAGLPAAAATYPGPYAWWEKGIRRYGFHGISHRYGAQRAAQLLQRDLAELKLITCHLGNGCSLAAVAGGQSIDTTMGFTPLDGLMMGSRSGSVDPGILIHLMRSEGYSADQLDHLLNKESGLLGVSGVSNDLRAVVDAIATQNPRAQLALDLFIHRLRREIGGMLASLGGLDALVFTAGIGENSPLVWEKASAAFQFLGLRLDPAKLERSPEDRDIAAADSAVRVLVIHTQEEWAIAQDCVALCQAQSG
ncbi:MAG: acetate kinase [Cyanobacteria bacterium Co-bin13]|nr:acetate kinase [Cyanobacteria bacterium Co-bin13]